MSYSSRLLEKENTSLHVLSLRRMQSTPRIMTSDSTPLPAVMVPFPSAAGLNVNVSVS